MGMAKTRQWALLLPYVAFVLEPSLRHDLFRRQEGAMFAVAVALPVAEFVTLLAIRRRVGYLAGMGVVAILPFVLAVTSVTQLGSVPCTLFCFFCMSITQTSWALMHIGRPPAARSN